MRTMLTVSLLLLACAGPQPNVRSNESGAASQQLDNTAIDVAMERIRPLVESCIQQGRNGQTWTVRLTILGDGHPREVQADADQMNPAIATCLEAAVSSAVFPQFSGPPMTVNYPYYMH